MEKHSARMVEVAGMVSRGTKPAEIARTFGISPQAARQLAEKSKVLIGLEESHEHIRSLTGKELLRNVAFHYSHHGKLEVGTSRQIYAALVRERHHEGLDWNRLTELAGTVKARTVGDMRRKYLQQLVKHIEKR